ncbi:unnamed protein product [Clonostachys byssicola]|uniref:Copper acquisition factor BIM1-like domain-containing protein n=1 Tax=Clonostachys byssicola TaxID=160290 RepID=A0A9N9UIG6_9HYPO|nr:unnamed protein product [Clonostachys byssicola]
MMFKTALALASAQIAAAHYGLVYPEWRADTLNAPEDSTLSQWTYPCAGADFGSGNITEWPLEGGSIQLDLHHAWTYVFLNLGLGENTTDFNITLTHHQLMNTTGKGLLCLDDIRLPDNSNVTQGAVGTLQVVTVGDTGSALYNCADIRFTANATKAPTCNNTVQHSFVQTGGNSSGSSGNNSTQSGNDKGAASVLGVNMLSVTTFAGLAVVFAMGLGM